MSIARKNDFREGFRIDPGARSLEEWLSWWGGVLEEQPFGQEASQSVDITLSQVVIKGPLEEARIDLPKVEGDAGERLYSLELRLILRKPSGNGSTGVTVHFAPMEARVILTVGQEITEHGPWLRDRFLTFIGEAAAQPAVLERQALKLDGLVLQAEAARLRLEEAKKELDELRTLAQDSSKQAVSAREEAQQAATKAETAAAEIRTTKEAVDALHKQVTDARADVTKAQAESKAFVGQIKTNRESMDGIQRDGRALLKEVRAEVDERLVRFQDAGAEIHKDFSERAQADEDRRRELLQQVQELLKVANAGSLSHSFQEKREELQRGLRQWMVGIVANTVLIAVLAVLVWVDPLGTFTKAQAGVTDLVLVKLSLVLPLLILDGFLIREYSRNRQLVQEYGFKAAVAQSLVSSDEMFREQRRTEGSLNFMVATLGLLYQPPMQKVEPAPRKGVVEGIKEVATVVNGGNAANAG